MAGGQAIAVSQGSLTVARRGQQCVAASGVVGLSVTLALVGAAISLSQGTANPNNDGIVALSGEAASVQQQAVAPSWGQAVTGVSASHSAGGLALVINPSTSGGQSVALGAGAVLAAGNDVTVNITGDEALLSSGFVESGGTVVSGSSVVGSAGAAAPRLTLAVSGQETAFAQGAVTPGQAADDTYLLSSHGSTNAASSVPLAGAELTIAQGAIGITGDVSDALLGASAAVVQGAAGFERAFELFGLSAASDQSSLGAPGGTTLTGASAGIVAGEVFTTNDRIFALVGESASASSGAAAAVVGASVEGQSLSSGSELIGPRGATLAGLEAALGAGAVVATTQATAPLDEQFAELQLQIAQLREQIKRSGGRPEWAGDPRLAKRRSIEEQNAKIMAFVGGLIAGSATRD